MAEENSTAQPYEFQTPPNSQIPIDLFVSKKYEGIGSRGFLRFTDSADNLVYTVKKSAHSVKLVVDSSGDTLFSIHRISKGSWQGFRVKDEEKDLIFTVDKTLDESSRTEFKILFAEKNDDSKTEFRMKGCPFNRSCTIYKVNSIVAESSLMHKLGFEKLFVTRNRFRVTIFPGFADHSLVASLVVIYFDGRRFWI
ncbi:hypothetical protein ABFX02_14G068700 [Erythranthe guttata]